MTFYLDENFSNLYETEDEYNEELCQKLGNLLKEIFQLGNLENNLKSEKNKDRLIKNIRLNINNTINFSFIHGRKERLNELLRFYVIYIIAAKIWQEKSNNISKYVYNYLDKIIPEDNKPSKYGLCKVWLELEEYGICVLKSIYETAHINYENNDELWYNYYKILSDLYTNLNTKEKNRIKKKFVNFDYNKLYQLLLNLKPKPNNNFGYL